MDEFKERSTRVYRQKQMLTKEELTERESLCVHEQSAFCAAACTLHLETRAFVGAMANGDFTAARAQIERVAPFPLILAHGCSAPCAAACRLGEVGEGVDIGALERAAMALGAPKKGAGMLKFKKKKTAAIFGGELFTLALAGELANKSYPLTFFCAQQSALELIANCAPFLPEAEANAECARLEAMDIELVYNAPLTPAFFEEKRGGYDVRCVSRALARSLGDAPDEVTLLCGALGAVTGGEGCDQALGALYDAKRAAVSVDRLAQGMDPGVSRGEEGARASSLYTNMEGVVPTRRVPEAGVYSAAQAVDEAKRCIQCQCVECVKGCAYLQHYGKFPRVLTREIYNNVSIIMGDHMMNKPINSCALCGQCSVTCPNGYDMAEICHVARRNMVSTGKMPLAPHEFALHDMLYSNGEAFLCRAQPGYEKSEYVFFPGCQAGAVAPLSVEKAYADLTKRLPGGVALLLGCCGVIADWAGRETLFAEQTALLRESLAALGNPKLIAGCPTCKRTLEGSLGLPVRGIWDVLGEIGLPEGATRDERSFVMHDSCGARGDAAMQSAVRALAGALGCALIDTEYSGDKTPCCGYGGLVSYVNRDVAREMAAKCTEEVPGAPYLTYCMACRDALAREGSESMHLLELIYAAPAGAPPDISGKRHNRLTLKNKLLKEIWGEDVIEMTYDFTLRITDEARAQMDERMILDTDVYAVMAAYRETGEAVVENDTGVLTACHRMGNVTFWVRFTEDGDGCTVLGAYSHRMTVE